MKIVNINGGLGNQLFQYFFGKYVIGKDNKVTFLLNDIKNYNSHQGLELNKVINDQIHFQDTPNNLFHLTSVKKILNKISNINKKWGGHYFEDPKIIISKKDINKNNFFCGYWQNIDYLDKFRTEIINDLTFIIDKKNKDQIRLISEVDNSVSIHFRKGDYLNSKEHFNLGIEYYSAAIEYVEKSYEKPKYFIFSDDVAWAKDSLKHLSCDFNFVEINHEKDSYLDMNLMSKCKINIIANSTFSWWASFINNHFQKKVIAPNNWFNHKDSYLYSIDMKKIL